MADTDWVVVEHVGSGADEARAALQGATVENVIHTIVQRDGTDRLALHIGGGRRVLIEAQDVGRLRLTLERREGEG